MYYIKDANMRRMTEYNGALCAEIGVLPGAVDDPALLVYFTQLSPGVYEMVRIIRNDASAELDWFDNSMHNAFEDVTDQAFKGSAQYSTDQEREKFKLELLAWKNIGQELERGFS